MTEPGEILHEEHEVIEHLLHVLASLSDGLERGDRVDPRDAEAALDVVTGFADRCHHAKEEKVLFPALLRASPEEAEALVRELEAEHNSGRRTVAAMRVALPGLTAGSAEARRNFTRAARDYVGLIEGHIAMETEALLPLMERALAPSQRAELAAEFDRIEREETGAGAHERYEGTIHRLAGKYVHRTPAEKAA